MVAFASNAHRHSRSGFSAAVRLSVIIGPEVGTAYEAACDHLATMVLACRPLRTHRRFSPQWFGQLNAAGWLTMSAMHMRLHRTKMQRIVQFVGLA